LAAQRERLLERAELRLFRLRTLQVRHPHPQEPDPALPVREFLGELLRDVDQDLLVEDMRCERPFPQVSLKSFEADLDSDRPEGRALGARSKEHVVGDVAERLSDDGPLGHVAVKGTLNADRFWIRPLLHRKLFESASDAPKPDRVLAENLLKLGAGKACELAEDRKSTRLNSSHEWISYAVFCLKKKKK